MFNKQQVQHTIYSINTCSEQTTSFRNKTLNKRTLHISTSIETPLLMSEFSYFKVQTLLTQVCNCAHIACIMFIERHNKRGCPGSAAREPKFTLLDAKCQLLEYKAPQHWTVDQWDCISGVMELHPVPLG